MMGLEEQASQTKATPSQASWYDDLRDSKFAEDNKVTRFTVPFPVISSPKRTSCLMIRPLSNAAIFVLLPQAEGTRAGNHHPLTGFCYFVGFSAALPPLLSSLPILCLYSSIGMTP